MEVSCINRGWQTLLFTRSRRGDRPKQRFSHDCISPNSSSPTNHLIQKGVLPGDSYE